MNSDKDAAMFNEPSWKNLKAVTDNHVLQFGPESSWLYNGPIASQEMVNDIRKTKLILTKKASSRLVVRCFFLINKLDA